MKCILHIGTEKTGTTILQNWLYSNKNVLSDNGVYLSDNIGKTNNRLLVNYFMSSFDGWFIANSITNNQEKDKYFENFLDEFTNEVECASDSHDYMIITSEHFHSRLVKREDLLNLKNFLDSLFDEIIVICYFREQAAVRKSLYSTALKVESDKKFEEFHSKIDESTYYYNYLRVADNWVSCFGEENCIFKIYDRKLFHKQDLRIDFINSLNMGLNYRDFNYDIESANESLTYLEALLFRMINSKVPFYSKSGKGVNALNRRFKKVVNLAEIGMGNIEDFKKDEIFKRFMNVNQAFFDKYFSGTYYFSQPLQAKENNATYSASQVAKLIERLFSSFLDEFGNIVDPL